MSDESTHEPPVSRETIRYCTRMLWYGVLVYLDFTTTLVLLGDIPLSLRRLVVIKSAVLIGFAFIVIRYTGEEQETD